MTTPADPRPLRRALAAVTLSAVLAVLPALPGAAVAADPGPTPAATGRVIVKFRAAPAAGRTEAAQALAARADTLGARRGLALRGGTRLDARTQVLLAEGVTSEALAQRLAGDAEVEWAVPDRRRHRLRQPNDPLFAPNPVPANGPASGQWYLKAPQATTLSAGTEIVSAINAEGAWDITTGTPSMVVAVLDTGVRLDHPDLAGKLLPGYDMVNDAAVANDGDGRDADASDPGDWVTADEADSGPFADCDVEPSSWHGTQVAALVGAATGNGQGMAGAGWQVRVLPVRVLGKCGGFDSDIIAGMRWAAGLPVQGLPDNPNPAAVINLSLGGAGACGDAYAETIAAVTSGGNGGRGTAVVVAAGNSTGRAVNSPANCPGVISVAAVRHIGTKVGFSDVGPEIALAAPGGNCVNSSGSCLYPILSASDTGTTGPQAPTYTEGNGAGVGTSFAAPLVSATVALMRTANRALTPAQLREALRASARPFPQTGAPPTTPASGPPVPVAACLPPTDADQLECYCSADTCGAGLLDARAAVAAVARLEPWIELASAAAPQPGQPLELSAANTVVPPGRSLAAVAWSLVDGGGIAALPAGAASGPTLGLTPTGNGVFTVRLTVTDSGGASASVDRTLQVGSGAPAPAAGGGGGAMSWPWLLGLLAAAGVLRRRGRDSR